MSANPMYEQSELLILGSASPRRKLLLEELGIQFECVAADIDETVLPGELPKDLVVRLALGKATKVAERFPNRFVLGADTDVEVDGQILGKPTDAQDAKRLLNLIAGRTHTVWGGCALVHSNKGLAVSIVSRTSVTMRSISDADVECYVSTGEPMDKAGAYAVQGLGSQFIDSIAGSYPNVVGLDTPRVVALLKEHGVLNTK